MTASSRRCPVVLVMHWRWDREVNDGMVVIIVGVVITVIIAEDEDGLRCYLCRNMRFACTTFPCCIKRPCDRNFERWCMCRRWIHLCHPHWNCQRSGRSQNPPPSSMPDLALSSVDSGVEVSFAWRCGSRLLNRHDSPLLPSLLFLCGPFWRDYHS